MNSDLYTQIPFEFFHRHFVLTHMKDTGAEVLAKLEQRADQSGETLGKLLAVWQSFKDALGRIKRQPTEQRHLTDSSTLLRTKNSRIKRCFLIRRFQS